MKPSITFKLFALSLLVLSARSEATQDQIFGLGGISSGRVGALSAETENPFAALSNPAALAAGTLTSFSLNAGNGGANPSLTGEVLVDSPTFFTRAGTLRTEKPELPSSSATLWSLGFNYPFNLPKWIDRRAGFGIVASGPFGQLRRYASVTPYDFAMLKYGTSEAQFKLTSSLGFEIVRQRLYAGAGVSFYLNGAGDAEARVLADNPTGRLALDVGLSSAAVVGLFSRVGDLESPHQVGLVYRQAVRPTFKQNLEGSVQIFRDGGLLTVPAVLSANLYYEPEAVELDWQKRLGEFNLSLGVVYQAWSKYEPPFVIVSSEDAAGAPRSTYVPRISMKDTLNPRVSVDGPLFQTTARFNFGYQFRPSAITDFSGDSNLLDTNTHVLAAALRKEFAPSDFLPLAVELSLYGQWHLFESVEVVKASPQSIGAPGYKLQGNAYSYGLSLKTSF